MPEGMFGFYWHLSIDTCECACFGQNRNFFSKQWKI